MPGNKCTFGNRSALPLSRRTRAEGKAGRCIDAQRNGDRIPLYRSSLNNSQGSSVPCSLGPYVCSHLTQEGHAKSPGEESTKGTSPSSVRVPLASDLSPKGYSRTLMAGVNEDAPLLTNETHSSARLLHDICLLRTLHLLRASAVSGPIMGNLFIVDRQRKRARFLRSYGKFPLSARYAARRHEQL